ncbi:MAG: CDP-alcohol phosphatidyltransferase family protein [Hyphomicrobiales bacterium]|nr:CDP-alcohol phosphatidyltransferase family protein [Hyphomicrobiales bacterium]
MFDSRIRRRIQAPLDAVGRRLARAGVSAEAVTWAGFGFGCAAAAGIVAGAFWAALALIALNRLADGLDGAVARASAATDRGGFLDITLDFAFYAAVPLSFAAHDPQANALAAAALLAGFTVNGVAFLAFALMAERRPGLAPDRAGKSFAYVAGLAEGAETIAVFAAFCVFPEWFAPVAFGFAALCAASAAARIALGARTFRA